MSHIWLEYKNYAVIGASTKEESYGYKITKSLASRGYTVIPISNKYEEVAGLKCYRKVTDYEGNIDVAVFVVNPFIGRKVIHDVVEKGIKRVITQPGARSSEINRLASEHHIEVSESCILVMLSWG